MDRSNEKIRQMCHNLRHGILTKRTLDSTDSTQGLHHGPSQTARGHRWIRGHRPAGTINGSWAEHARHAAPVLLHFHVPRDKTQFSLMLRRTQQAHKHTLKRQWRKELGEEQLTGAAQRDRTERRQAQQQFAEARSVLRTALIAVPFQGGVDNFPVGLNLVHIDQTGRIWQVKKHKQCEAGKIQLINGKTNQSMDQKINQSIEQSVQWSIDISNQSPTNVSFNQLMTD